MVTVIMCLTVLSQKRHRFWEWCRDHGIDVEYYGTWKDKDFWMIRDEAHRAWAILKWT